MISLMFTRSNKIGSKLIRWGYMGETSHFAIGFDDKIVFHSHFGGPRVDWHHEFISKNELVYSIYLDLALELEEKIYSLIRSKQKFSGYDYGALFYAALSTLLSRLFMSGRFDRNLWASSRRALCLEMAEYLEPITGKIQDLDTMFPDELYFLLKDKLHGNLSSH